MNNQRRFGRPRLKRKIGFSPQVNYFKPQGVPMSSLEVVNLTKEELEAMRLKNIEDMDQRKCAEAMHTSPATLQRILASAYNKISIALIEGRAIKITKE